MKPQYCNNYPHEGIFANKTLSLLKTYVSQSATNARTIIQNLYYNEKDFNFGTLPGGIDRRFRSNSSNCAPWIPRYAELCTQLALGFEARPGFGSLRFGV